VLLQTQDLLLCFQASLDKTHPLLLGRIDLSPVSLSDSQVYTHLVPYLETGVRNVARSTEMNTAPPEMDATYVGCLVVRCLSTSMEMESVTRDRSSVLSAPRHSHSGVTTRLTRNVTRNSNRDSIPVSHVARSSPPPVIATCIKESTREFVPSNVFLVESSSVKKHIYRSTREPRDISRLQSCMRKGRQKDSW